jgi:hypothetical protein
MKRHLYAVGLLLSTILMIVGLVTLSLVMTDFWVALMTITLISGGYVLIYKMLEDE